MLFNLNSKVKNYRQGKTAKKKKFTDILMDGKVKLNVLNLFHIW